MKFVHYTFIAALMIIAVSCGNKKKKCNKECESKKMEQTNVYKTERGTIVTVSLVDMNTKIPSDPFQLIDAHVDDDNKLHLTVEYGGGCKEHEFKILGSNAILKSMPAQRPVMIVHIANSDECRSIIREEILIDISDFAYTKEDGSQIILLLDGQRLSFIYQAPGSNDK
jgi:hypothetical protein